MGVADEYVRLYAPHFLFLHAKKGFNNVFKKLFFERLNIELSLKVAKSIIAAWQQIQKTARLVKMCFKDWFKVV